MATTSLVLPSLRGAFGSWIFYSCLMPIGELSTRVGFAEEIHPDRALSKLIQRRLTGARAKQIASYLASAPDRFFNSLVLATYAGAPEWLEVGNLRSSSQPTILKEISERARDSIGFLRLSGAEKIFALDGQHRLAGIRQALADGTNLEDDLVPVLMVGHKNDKVGKERTRRLFTTLNKTAVPVQKADIIALDEDDAMAIIARRLVEENMSFRHPKVAVISSTNMPVSNHESLMTISSLYDVLKILFLHDLGKASDRTLKTRRPTDTKLEHYYAVATAYFSALGKAFKPVRDLFAAADPSAITTAQRHGDGGHLLFRSIGLEIFTRTSVALATAKGTSVADAVHQLRLMPIDITKPPFRNVLWDPVKHKIIVTEKTLARDLTFHMAGLPVSTATLRTSYRRAVGNPQAVLPAQL